jgi:MFS family permease
MRQGGYQAVWTGALTQKGRLTGILWGLVSLGSTIGVLVGGFLYDRGGYHAAILFVIVMAVLAVPVALFIRWPAIHLHLPTLSEELHKDAAGGEGSDGSWASVWKSPVQRWLVIAGFFQLLISGVIVSTTAIFVATRLGSDSELAWLGIGVATLTGIIHGVRWIADLALGPAMGAL